MNTQGTLFDKVWDAHVVTPGEGGAPDALYIDLHLLHEVTSPQAFAALEARGLGVRRPERCLATLDHAIPTTEPEPARWPGLRADAARQVAELEANCARHGIRLLGRDAPERGIVHVAAPELGAVLPGATIVCGDSHTSTHGAFGALAFGVGTSEVAHVLATQCVLQRRPRTMSLRVDGALVPGVSAKDVALAVIGRIGASGAAGHVIEYSGSAVDALSMEGRMTLCNMSIEAGARAGMIAPDERTFEWLEGRPLAPAGARFEEARARWSALGTDEGARFDRTVELDLGAVAPQVTWGTSPDQVSGVDREIPEPTSEAARRALDCTGLEVGAPLRGQGVDVVFIGSCTNGRIEDLREAARVMGGRRVAAGTRTVIVPGSRAVQRAAEAEGLAEVFRAAGAEWRAPGCSMCIAMNGDAVPPGQRAISTSNRNFVGRQGPGSATLLASPATAAASALEGAVADPRAFLA